MSICFYADISIFVPQSIIFVGGEHLCQSQKDMNADIYLFIFFLNFGFGSSFCLKKVDVFILNGQIYGVLKFSALIPHR